MSLPKVSTSHFSMGNGMEWKVDGRWRMAGDGRRHLVCQSNKLLTDQRGNATEPAKRIRAASIFSSCPGQRGWRRLPNNHQHHPIEKLWKIAAKRGHWSGLEILRHWQNEANWGGRNGWLTEVRKLPIFKIKESGVFFCQILNQTYRLTFVDE